MTNECKIRMTEIAFGGTIVLPGNGRFKEEKRWASFTAEVGHGDSPNIVMNELRERFDKWEEEERSRYNGGPR